MLGFQDAQKGARTFPSSFFLLGQGSLGNCRCTHAPLEAAFQLKQGSEPHVQKWVDTWFHLALDWFPLAKLGQGTLPFFGRPVGLNPGRNVGLVSVGLPGGLVVLGQWTLSLVREMGMGPRDRF